MGHSIKPVPRIIENVFVKDQLQNQNLCQPPPGLYMKGHRLSDFYSCCGKVILAALEAHLSDFFLILLIM